ncbi:helix-turn-helix transcriptional regulator [Sphingobium sp. AN641]|uniref:helix-turn-helix transcriptional regulator n=1 Tax=Sphingobium sp. AN641 TaxID=3133443 RepID=UPI0030C28119
MHHPNRLSVQRRTWALTQKELANLIDTSEDAISSYELAKTVPMFMTAIALELVFDTRLATLFPDTTHAVAQRMLPILADLSIKVEQLESSIAAKKRTLVTRIGNRIEKLTRRA